MTIFCVGIGGIGLSGIAQILKAEGHRVFGSDSSVSSITDDLIKSGIPVFAEHKKEHIDQSVGLLIYSEAVPESNPEREQARELHVPAINYAEALGMVTKGKKVIAITGTHGKTTVTGMLTTILLEAGLDPSIIVGSTLPILDHKNFRIGKSELFLTEACEYRDNFQELTPEIMLINTLEPDHLDYFKTAKRYYASFQKLAEKLPAQGTLIMFENDVKKLNLDGVVANKIVIECEISPCALKTGLSRNDRPLKLLIPGKHNQHNALAALTVAKVLRVPEDLALKALSHYEGAARRFEFKGKVHGAELYDDYAHHPSKVRATLQAAREKFPHEKIVAVFQPHQFSRTREFFVDYTKAFEAADEAWITDIYEARDTEQDKKSVSGQMLASAITKPRAVRHVPLQDIATSIEKSASAKTVFLIMGAGNITKIFSDIAVDEERDSSTRLNTGLVGMTNRDD